MKEAVPDAKVEINAEKVRLSLSRVSSGMDPYVPAVFPFIFDSWSRLS